MSVNEPVLLESLEDGVLRLALNRPAARNALSVGLMSALADAFGITVVPHSAYFGPGLIASIHCIAALSGGKMQISIHAAGELVPALEVLDAVGSGVAPRPEDEPEP